VVNGKSAIWGLAALTAARRLAVISQHWACPPRPAIRDQFQPPQNPRSSPSWPDWQLRRRAVVEDLIALPAAHCRFGGNDFSPIVVDVVDSGLAVYPSNTWVPTGTLSTIGLPLAPCRSLPMPVVPFFA